MGLSKSKKIAIASGFEGFYKSTFGQIPIIGTPLVELAFEYGNRIQQERLNLFSQMLKEYFEEVNEEEIDIENITTEDFHDIFKSIMKKVVETKCIERLKRFRTILIKQLKEPGDFDEVEIYINVTNKLLVNHFKILVFYNEIYDKQVEAKKLIQENNTKVESLKQERLSIDLLKNSTMKKRQLKTELDDKIEKYQKELDNLLTKHSLGDGSIDVEGVFGVNRGKYSYLVYELAGMFLLEQGQFIKAPMAGGKFYNISSFGKEYLEYIRES